jgi:hypothetical protein
VQTQLNLLLNNKSIFLIFLLLLHCVYPFDKNRLTDRHSKLKEKWAVDRAEQVGEAGTISAASKVFWDHFQAEVKHTINSCLFVCCCCCG